MGSCVPTLPRFLDRHGEPPSSPALWPPCVEDERGSSRHTARTLRASSAGLLRVSSVNQEPFPDLPLREAPSVLRLPPPPWPLRPRITTRPTRPAVRVPGARIPFPGASLTIAVGRTEGFPISPRWPHRRMPTSLTAPSCTTHGFPHSGGGRPSTGSLVVGSFSLGLRPCSLGPPDSAFPLTPCPLLRLLCGLFRCSVILAFRRHPEFYAKTRSPSRNRRGHTTVIPIAGSWYRPCQQPHNI